MSTIEDRIVNMKFNASQFQSGVSQTLGSLDSLKKGLNLQGAGAGLEALDSKAAKNSSSFEKMAAGVQNISSKFSALGVVGITVLANLTNTALGFIKNTAGKVLDPIITGGTNRAHAIEQAKFQFQGLGLDIDKTMDSALKAVKGTSFGLDEAATAAAQFGASGITAGHGLTESLRAISGVAAQTGSDYGDIANIFAGVAGNGRLMGDDLLQMSSRGVNAAAILGKALGKSESDIRDLVSKGKIDFKTFSDVMNSTFGKNAAKASETYSGALSNMRAALSRVGASLLTEKFEAQRKVMNAVTPVIDNLHAALEPLFTIMGKLENQSSDGLVKFLKSLDFSKVSLVMPDITKGIRRMFKAAQAIIDPFKKAFAEVFPPATEATLLKLSSGFLRFTKGLILTKEASGNLKDTIAGVFAVFDIAFQVVKAFVTVLARLIPGLSDAGGGVLDFTGGIGKFLVSLDKAIRSGSQLTDFFTTVGNIISVPLKFILAMVKGLLSFATALSDIGFGKLKGQADSVSGALAPLAKLGDAVAAVWGHVKELFAGLADIFGPIGDALSKLGGALVDVFTDALNTGDFSGILSIINTGFLGGIVLLLKKFFTDGLKLDFGSGFVEQITGVFEGLTGTLGAMQQQLKAEALRKIAISIAILVAAIFVLSTIDSGKLTKSLGAITVMFAQLAGSLALLNTIPVAGISKMPIIASGLIALSVAILILSVSVRVLGSMDLDDLAKGLAGVAISLGLIVAFGKTLTGSAKGMYVAAGAMILIGVAIRILASAVKAFAGLSWEELAKGLISVGLVLKGLALFNELNTINKGATVNALGIILLGAALNIIAKAVGSFGKLSVAELAKGLIAMGLALDIVSLGIQAIPPSSIIGAAALVVVSVALNILADALGKFGSMSWGAIAKSMVLLVGSLALIALGLTAMVAALPGAAALVIASGALWILAPVLERLGKLKWSAIAKIVVGLAGVLLILAVGLTAMIASLPGAAALVVASGALAILQPVLAAFGAMEWSTIISGLGALALTLTVLGVAGILLIPAIPGLIGLGIAVTLLGAATLLAGVGVLAFATGLTALAAAGIASGAGLKALFQGILDLIPMAIQALGDALVQLAAVIGKSAPAIVSAMSTLILSMLKAIQNVAPEIVNTVIVLMNQLIVKLGSYVPGWADKGLAMITALLNKIADNIPDVVAAGTRVIVAFIKALGSNSSKIADAGAKTIVDFVNSIATAVRNNSGDMRKAGLNLATALADGMSGGLASKASGLATKAANLGKGAVGAIKDAIDSHSPSKETYKVGEYFVDGFGNAIEDGGSHVDGVAHGVGKSAVNAMQKAISDVGTYFSDSVDTNPTIKPVLDLTAIQRGTGEMGKLFTGVPSIKTDAVAGSADIAASGYTSNKDAALNAADQQLPQAPTVKFEQNNYSPVALSNNDIYRRTNNQLSQAKDALSK